MSPDSDVALNRIEAITELHNEIAGYMRMSLKAAIEIGRLLNEQKAELAHGEFTPWVEVNLPFTMRTAQRYMRAYQRRDEIAKSDNVSVLTEAYRLLEAPRAREEPPEPGIAARGEAVVYSDTLKKIIDLLPTEPPQDVDGIADESRRLALEIIKRLEPLTRSVGLLERAGLYGED